MEKQLINTKEDVQFVQSDDNIINLNPIARQPVFREEQRL